ncbi:MAG: hypothetical protein L6V93_20370 [Clostridiales bacterium]|nr:MAG: hypothetical protein L6V93_20370 [Clostridiales bacterium]
MSDADVKKVEAKAYEIYNKNQKNGADFDELMNQFFRGSRSCAKSRRIHLYKRRYGERI